VHRLYTVIVRANTSRVVIEEIVRFENMETLEKTKTEYQSVYWFNACLFVLAETHRLHVHVYTQILRITRHVFFFIIILDYKLSFNVIFSNTCDNLRKSPRAYKITV